MTDPRRTSLGHILARFRGLKAVVLGDPILDGFLSGAPTRLCREQPVPVVLKSREDNRPGGAANTAANLRALGGRVALVGVVGEDAPGDELRRCLDQAGVDCGGLVVDRSRPTAHKLRILAREHYVARVDFEPSVPPGPLVEQHLMERLESELARCDVAVVSDYGLGSVSPAAMWLASRTMRRRGLPVVLDAKDLLRHAGVPVTVATPNWDEAQAAAGLLVPGEAPSAEDLECLGRELHRRLDVDNIVVTRGADGVVLVGRTGLPVQLAGRSSQARNAVGAGDSLVAALALGLATGASLGDSVRLGMESAAIAVTKPHTAAVSFAELSESLGTAGWDPETLPRATISAQTEILLCQARSAGKRLVLTNGIFDLLHEGHVSLLRRARCLGDLLVVALNSDESVRGLKGEGRPINNVEERRALLEALGCVDQVIVFDGPSAASVVRAVRPDVYVKGDDHEIERLPEAVLARQLGARLVSMPRVHAVSTTQIIDRVLARANPGGRRRPALLSEPSAGR